MNTADFIKLPAREAGDLYRKRLETGDAEGASQLHQAYFEVHRIRLSDERQVAEAMAPPKTAAVSKEQPTRRERSSIRRVGIALSVVGLVIAAFVAAASIGVGALLFFLGVASTGFTLWLVGLLEDCLIGIREAIELR